jgi:hypothetical protein
LHTLNPRLAPEQVVWIINDAQDVVLCFDLTFLPIIEAVATQCPSVKQWVLMADADRLPATTSIPGLVDYESWIAGESTEYTWPEFDERTAAALCYTSGTTGNPKGVLYSHRSTVLHAYAGAMPDAMNLSSRDSVLPVVPMFHVNAWGIPYVAAMVGVKLVFPGAALDGKSLDRVRGRHHGCGGPDGMARIVEPCRFGSRRLRNDASNGHRRIGVSPGYDRALPRSGCDRVARLGYDRDVAARHAEYAQRQALGRPGSRSARPHGKTG